jgi:glycosyltransferase involved in cell wall biosynthesis
MKILHITSHLGGGLGTVILDWMDHLPKDSDHAIVCLDYMNDKAKERLARIKLPHIWSMSSEHKLIHRYIENSDIVLCHFYDHPMLADLFAEPIPDCRLVWWCHKNVVYSPAEVAYPDLWLDTSPIQGHGRYIWSCGDISRFLAIQPKKHEGFNIGTVVSMKMDIKGTLNLFMKIGELIPEAYFTWIGDFTPMNMLDYHNVRFLGKVPDIAPYLAEMDIFAYPLKPDHYGTCEQVLGEAMAAGIPPVVMDNPAERFIWSARCKSEKEYIDTIASLYQYPYLRNELSMICRGNAMSLYNIDQMISEWNTVFDDMMKNPKSKHGGLK